MQTQLLGERLGTLLEKGDVILLVGELGAGKTCFVQGLSRGLEVEQYAFSPSFVLIREYHGRIPLYHVDLYRLNSVEEIDELGLDEYLFGTGVCVIEWAEKGFSLVPDEYLLMRIEYDTKEETYRTITMYPEGVHYRELVKKLEMTLDKGYRWN